MEVEDERLHRNRRGGAEAGEVKQEKHSRSCPGQDMLQTHLEIHLLKEDNLFGNVCQDIR